ncbi:hypothetical protein [Campylobacter troglodytis]|uniref:hypothetical protein n=1 Tax=Campylobacter troglodytis TaxID=654363 RepID=UPI001159564E|nr:hypothetical protein [Campylobacter troglodytis]
MINFPDFPLAASTAIFNFSPFFVLLACKRLGTPKPTAVKVNNDDFKNARLFISLSFLFEFCSFNGSSCGHFRGSLRKSHGGRFHYLALCDFRGTTHEIASNLPYQMAFKTHFVRKNSHFA